MAEAVRTDAEVKQLADAEEELKALFNKDRVEAPAGSTEAPDTAVDDKLEALKEGAAGTLKARTVLGQTFTRDRKGGQSEDYALMSASDKKGFQEEVLRPRARTV